jgi:hypothetical protein
MKNSLPLFPFNKGTHTCGVPCKRKIVELQFQSNFNVIEQYTLGQTFVKQTVIGVENFLFKKK